MRTGAIFARGSCRALKWMALVGVVFALGAGQALAQDAEVKVRLGTNKPAEGGALVPVTVTVTPAADATVPGNLTLTLTLTSDPETDTTPPSDTRGELGATDADVAWQGIARGTAATGELVFNWGDSRETDTETINMRTYRDTDAEDEKFIITTTGGDASTDLNDPVKFTVIDAQTQTFVLRHPFNSSGEVDEGTTSNLELEAVPLKTGPVAFRVTLDSEEDSLEDYSLSTTTASISEEFTIPHDGATPGVILVPFVTEGTDGDRVDDTVTFEVTYADGDKRGSPAMDDYFQLTVIDLDKLPKITLDKIEVPDEDDKLQEMDYIPEGKIGTVTLKADRSPRDVPSSEDIKIMLRRSDASTADTRDYTLSGSPVEMDGSATSGTFTVDVDADEDVGMESLVLEAKVEGTKANGPNPEDPYDLDPIAFNDETPRQIEPKSDAMVNEAIEAARRAGDANGNGLWTAGETLTVTADELFTFGDTTNVVLGNIQITPAGVVSHSTTNDALTVTATGEGEAMVTVTGTVVPESSSAIPQTLSNVAQVAFSIMVDAPMITAKGDAQEVADEAIEKAAMESANGIWEPAPNGATAMIALSDLFDVPDSIEGEYLARSSDSADVSVDISADMTMVELTPEGAGMATITVTAVDTDRPGNAVSVDFTATVVAQAAVRGLSQAEVDDVFEAAGADALVAQGPSISLDMSDLFEVGPNVTPSYSAGSSDMDVLSASASGTMLMLTPGQGVAGGSATITVTALDTASGANASVEYMAMVDKLPPVVTITSMPMSGSAVEEGGAITVTATLNQEAPHDKSIELDVSGPATGPEAIMLATGAMSASATLTVDDDNAVMAMPDIVVVASHEAIAGGSAVLNFSVMENDMETTYTVDVSAMSIMEGGEAVTITATASQAVMADTMIELQYAGTTASEDDYSLDPAMITIDEGETTGTAMLMATDDDEVEGMESLTLNAVMGSMIVDSLTLEVGDNDEAPEPTNLVTAKSSEDIEPVLVAAGLGDDAMFNTGATAMVDASMLFDAADGVSVSYAAESDDMAAASTSTSGSMVTVTAGMAGHAHIMITATATMASGIEIHTGQPATNVATVVFSVNVTQVDLVVTLSGPDDMNLVEGESYEITATANRAVTEDTMVELVQMDGTASPADYEVGTITINAGETMGSTMLMVTEDDMPENAENMAEMLTLGGRVGAMKTNALSFYLWDAAVPALPVIAQLLLAGLLGVGGYRRFRRR